MVSPPKAGTYPEDHEKVRARKERMPQAILSTLPRDVPCLRVPAVTLENVSRNLKIEKGWVGIETNKRIKIKEKN